jgi:hypothetical protein
MTSKLPILVLLSGLLGCGEETVEETETETETDAPRTRSGDVEAVVTPIEAPLWAPTDFVIFKSETGKLRDATDIINCLMPPEEHIWDVPSMQWLPAVEGGVESDYGTDMSRAVEACGFTSTRLLQPQDLEDPSAIFLGFMIVPGPDAPSGRTIDFEDGPLIPEALFPLETSLNFYREGELVDYITEIIHPRLDDLGIPGMGLSHVPMLLLQAASLAAPNMDTAGVFRWSLRVEDATYAGYDITVDMFLGDEAAGGPGYQGE